MQGHIESKDAIVTSHIPMYAGRKGGGGHVEVPLNETLHLGTLSMSIRR